MSISRRTVVRGAAWSVPVIAVAAQAPAFAASVCAQVPLDGWTFVVAPANTLSTGGVTGLITDATRGQMYLSEKDNTALAQVTITGTRSLVLVAGRAYTFTYTVRSRFAGGVPRLSSGNQFLRVQLAGVVDQRWVKSNLGTNLVLDGQVYTALSSASDTNVYETFSFAFTPTAAQTTPTLTYTFTLPGTAISPAPYSDVAVTAPVITGQGC